MTGKTYYIYGKNAVLLATQKSPEKIINILIAERSYTLPPNIKIIKADKNFFDKKFGKVNHQFIAAEIIQTEKQPIETILNKEKSLIVMLDQITDPHNFGAIMRSAAAFGVDCIISSQNHTVSDLGIIGKTSAGTSELMPIYYYNLSSFLSLAGKYNFWSYALDISATKNIYEEKYPDKAIIIMGSEGKGVRKLVLENADVHLKIPMVNTVESLNVSCACSIILSHIYAIKQ